jgi:hypothetical protein
MMIIHMKNNRAQCCTCGGIRSFCVRKLKAALVCLLQPPSHGLPGTGPYPGYSTPSTCTFKKSRKAFTARQIDRKLDGWMSDAIFTLDKLEVGHETRTHPHVVHVNSHLSVSACVCACQAVSVSVSVPPGLLFSLSLFLSPSLLWRCLLVVGRATRLRAQQRQRARVHGLSREAGGFCICVHRSCERPRSSALPCKYTRQQHAPSLHKKTLGNLDPSPSSCVHQPTFF